MTQVEMSAARLDADEFHAMLRDWWELAWKVAITALTVVMLRLARQDPLADVNRHRQRHGDDHWNGERPLDDRHPHTRTGRPLKD